MFVEGPQPADQEVGDEVRQEDRAHQGRLQPLRRGAGDQGQGRRPVIEEGDSQDRVVGQGPEDGDAAADQTGRDQHEVGDRRHEGALADLAEVAGLAAMRVLPAPNQEDQGDAQDADRGVHGVEPGHRDVEAQDVQVDASVDPDQVHIDVLAVGDGLEDGDRRCCADGEDHLQLIGRQRDVGFCVPPPGTVRRQMTVTEGIGRKARQHQDPRQGEAGMPAPDLGQQAAEQRSQHRPDVDAGREDREAPRTPLAVGLGIELADLAGDIALQKAAAHDQEGEGGEEGGVEGHQQVAGAHQHRAQDHRQLAADQPVGDQAAQHRGEIDQAGVEPHDLRGERQGAHLAEHPLQPGAERAEAGDVAEVRRQEQRLGHVEHQERRHPVEGEPLPGLGEGQIGQDSGLAEEASARGGQLHCRVRRGVDARQLAPADEVRRASVLASRPL